MDNRSFQRHETGALFNIDIDDLTIPLKLDTGPKNSPSSKSSADSRENYNKLACTAPTKKEIIEQIPSISEELYSVARCSPQNVRTIDRVTGISYTPRITSSIDRDSGTTSNSFPDSQFANYTNNRDNNDGSAWFKHYMRYGLAMYGATELSFIDGGAKPLQLKASELNQGHVKDVAIIAVLEDGRLIVSGTDIIKTCVLKDTNLMTLVHLRCAGDQEVALIKYEDENFGKKYESDIGDLSDGSKFDDAYTIELNIRPSSKRQKFDTGSPHTVDNRSSYNEPTSKLKLATEMDKIMEGAPSYSRTKSKKNKIHHKNKIIKSQLNNQEELEKASHEFEMEKEVMRRKDQQDKALREMEVEKELSLSKTAEMEMEKQLKENRILEMELEKELSIKQALEFEKEMELSAKRSQEMEIEREILAKKLLEMETEKEIISSKVLGLQLEEEISKKKILEMEMEKELKMKDLELKMTNDLNESENQLTAKKMSDLEVEKELLAKRILKINTDKEKSENKVSELEKEKEQYFRRVLKLEKELDCQRKNFLTVKNVKNERELYHQKIEELEKERDKLKQQSFGMKEVSDNFMKSMSEVEHEKQLLVQRISEMEYERELFLKQILEMESQNSEVKKFQIIEQLPVLDNMASHEAKYSVSGESVVKHVQTFCNENIINLPNIGNLKTDSRKIDVETASYVEKNKVGLLKYNELNIKSEVIYDGDVGKANVNEMNEDGNKIKDMKNEDHGKGMKECRKEVTVGNKSKSKKKKNLRQRINLKRRYGIEIHYSQVLTLHVDTLLSNKEVNDIQSAKEVLNKMKKLTDERIEALLHVPGLQHAEKKKTLEEIIEGHHDEVQFEESMDDSEEGVDSEKKIYSDELSRTVPSTMESEKAQALVNDAKEQRSMALSQVIEAQEIPTLLHHKPTILKYVKKKTVVKVEDNKEHRPDLEVYWRAVRINPADFKEWTNLLQYVEKLNNSEEITEAYDAFLKKFPYCYGYWKKYANMHRKHGNIQEALQVFERGVDCNPLSIDLWISFISFASNHLQYDSVVEKEENIRGLYVRAVDSCGMEFRSERIWNDYITWETGNSNFINIYSIYKMIMTIPTMHYQQQFERFVEFLKQHDPREYLDNDLIKFYNKAKNEVQSSITNITSYSTSQKDEIINMKITDAVIAKHRNNYGQLEAEVGKRLIFEEKIKRTFFHVKPLEPSQIENWENYLDFEILQGKQIAIVVLFERCLIACAQYEHFWIKYASYMECHDVLEACEILSRACTIHLPSKPHLHITWAAFEENCGNTVKAMEILDNINEIHPGLIPVVIRRIGLYRRLGYFGDVEKLYEENIEKASSTGVASYFSKKLARFFQLVLKDRDKSMETILAATQSDCYNQKLYLQLLDMELHSNDSNEHSILEIFALVIQQEESPLDLRICFSRRRLEYLEDFGSNIAILLDAYKSHEKLMKELKKVESEAWSQTLPHRIYKSQESQVKPPP